MTATLATIPLDVILCISAFIGNSLDALSLSQVRRHLTSVCETDIHVCVRIVRSQTCRSTFLASLENPSYWLRSVPAAHLPRAAPWNSYSASELREACVRYAASYHWWGSPSPTVHPPFRLPPPHGPDSDQHESFRWRSIRGTRWAWSLQHFTGDISFCDLRTGLHIGKWSAGGWVSDALIESRSPNHWMLCHWKNLEYVPLADHIFPIPRQPIGLALKLARHQSHWSKRTLLRRLR